MGQRRFAVAYMDVFDGVLHMAIRETETAFDACIAYLTEEFGYEFDNDILEQCNGDIDQLSYDCLLDNFVSAIEIS